MIGLVLFLHYKYNNFLNCCESQVKVKERLNGRSYLEHVNANLKKKNIFFIRLSSSWTNFLDPIGSLDLTLELAKSSINTKNVSIPDPGPKSNNLIDRFHYFLHFDPVL